MIRVIQLITPDIDIAELWNKDEIHEDEEQFGTNEILEVFSKIL